MPRIRRRCPHTTRGRVPIGCGGDDRAAGYYSRLLQPGYSCLVLLARAPPRYSWLPGAGLNLIPAAGKDHRPSNGDLCRVESPCCDAAGAPGHFGRRDPRAGLAADVHTWRNTRAGRRASADALLQHSPGL
jgi:hypothetical protein